jgi:hypothetical protein
MLLDNIYLIQTPSNIENRDLHILICNFNVELLFLKLT